MQPHEIHVHLAIGLNSVIPTVCTEHQRSVGSFIIASRNDRASCGCRGVVGHDLLCVSRGMVVGRCNEGGELLDHPRVCVAIGSRLKAEGNVID